MCVGRTRRGMTDEGRGTRGRGEERVGHDSCITGWETHGRGAAPEARGGVVCGVGTHSITSARHPLSLPSAVSSSSPVLVSACSCAFLFSTCSSATASLAKAVPRYHCPRCRSLHMSTPSAPLRKALASTQHRPMTPIPLPPKPCSHGVRSASPSLLLSPAALCALAALL